MHMPVGCMWKTEYIMGSTRGRVRIGETGPGSIRCVGLVLCALFRILHLTST